MPWKKGESGNPSGRPKSDVKLQELARKHTDAAIKTLATIMQDAGASQAARVSAATAILDRGYGKPPQFTTSDPAAFRRANEMSDDELASIAAGSSEGTPETEGDQAVVH